MTRDCDDLDAYLADDLDAQATARFESHVEQCTFCRDAVAQQGWIDGLLRLSTAFESDIPPPGLEQAIRSAIDRPRRRARLAAGLAAAATIALVVALGWRTSVNRPPESPADFGTADLAATPAGDAPADDAPVESMRATFVGGPDTIVVPVESRHPDVTIVRVYPAYRPDESDQANAGQPAAAENFSLPEPFPGG